MARRPKIRPAQRAVVRRGSRTLAFILIGFVALALALIVGLELAAKPGTQAAASSIGGPFELVDQDGRTVTDATYRGKWLLVYFGYTHCPDACPTALNEMAEALDGVGARRQKIQPLFISVDPNDTPAVLKPYTASFDPTIVGLTGSAEQIASVAKAYHVAIRREREPDGDYAIDHSSAMFLISPEGRLAANLSHDTTVEAMIAKLKAAIS
jgi:protein SCO1/2